MSNFVAFLCMRQSANTSGDEDALICASAVPVPVPTGASSCADALYFAGARQEPTSPSVTHHGGIWCIPESELCLDAAAQAGNLLPGKWSTGPSCVAPGLLLNGGPISFDNDINSSVILAF